MTEQLTERRSRSCFANSCSASGQQGVGIIEVLIALVVVSLGVLGMASLQLTGMKHSSSGYNRSMAVLFAENLATRMRSNPDSVIQGHYAGYDSNTGADCTVAPATMCQASYLNPAAECNAQEMAQFDLFSIACGSLGTSGAPEDGITDLLNGGRLQVACNDSPCENNSNYTLTITWNEGRTTTNDEAQDLKTVQLRFNP